jgi:hypothetical protein
MSNKMKKNMISKKDADSIFESILEDQPKATGECDNEIYQKRGFSLRWIEDFAEELYKVGDYATLTKSGCLLESVTCFVDEIRQKLVFEEPLPKKGKI